MQYWDDVLYPPFRATIRGEYYGIVTEDYIDEEWFLEELKEEEQFILDEPKRAKEIKEKWHKYYNKNDDPFATFKIKDNRKIEF